MSTTIRVIGRSLVGLKSAPKYRKIKLTQLFVDSNYQRTLSDAHLEKIRVGFNSMALRSLVVSKRKRKYAVLDGQHRFEIMKEKGIATVMCEIWEGLEPEQEAVLFVLVNESKYVPPTSKFKALLYAKEPTEIAIEKICEKNGFVVQLAGRPRKYGTQGIRSIATLYKLTNLYDLDGLNIVLQVIRDGFTVKGDNNLIQGAALKDMFMLGVAEFIHKNIHEYDVSTMIEAINGVCADQIASKARCEQIYRNLESSAIAMHLENLLAVHTKTSRRRRYSA